MRLFAAYLGVLFLAFWGNFNPLVELVAWVGMMAWVEAATSD